MQFAAGIALALALLLGGCTGGARALKCPQPVVYDDATLKKIQKAREDLPKDNVLHQVLADFETERDELRYCK